MATSNAASEMVSGSTAHVHMSCGDAESVDFKDSISRHEFVDTAQSELLPGVQHRRVLHPGCFVLSLPTPAIMFKQDVDIYSAMESGYPFDNSYSMDEAMTDKIVRQGFVRKVFGVVQAPLTLPIGDMCVCAGCCCPGKWQGCWLDPGTMPLPFAYR